MTHLAGQATQGRLDVQSGGQATTMARVCKAVVRIHKHFYGKGPTRARAHLVENLLTVTLEGGFTRTEQILGQCGHEDEVVRWRLAMRHSTENVFRGEIEGVLGRSVRSFMSACDPAGGLQVEIFVLNPGRVDDADPPLTDDAALSGPPDDGSPAADDRIDELLAARARQVREDHRRILDEHRALRAEQEQSRRAVEHERGRMRREDDQEPGPRQDERR